MEEIKDPELLEELVRRTNGTLFRAAFNALASTQPDRVRRLYVDLHRRCSFPGNAAHRAFLLPTFEGLLAVSELTETWGSREISWALEILAINHTLAACITPLEAKLFGVTRARRGPWHSNAAFEEYMEKVMFGRILAFLFKNSIADSGGRPLPTARDVADKIHTRTGAALRLFRRICLFLALYSERCIQVN